MSDSKSTGMSEAKRRLLEQWRKGGGAAVTPKAAQKAATGIPPRGDDGPAPLSFSQQRFWFLHQLEPESPAYHLSRVVRLRGPLDRDALTRAVAELVARHESLRTVFPDTAEGARAVLLPVERVALRIETLDATDEAALDAFSDRTVRAPFDLTDGPLFRPCLAVLADDDHVLALAMHHILSDGWSLGVL
ncbi:MAG: condensation domain-containing protein, partial [Acidobacteriota bacterium]